MDRAAGPENLVLPQRTETCWGAEPACRTVYLAEPGGASGVADTYLEQRHTPADRAKPLGCPPMEEESAGSPTERGGQRMEEPPGGWSDLWWPAAWTEWWPLGLGLAGGPRATERQGSPSCIWGDEDPGVTPMGACHSRSRISADDRWPGGKAQRRSASQYLIRGG
ncbi:hypothetical protein NDU88_003533 [Pleurodeles waltl]|uniref:Uncharacterized protein n=1 Tax=Pleurodeles waltl TaxID=8319 RepID=A0AAV7PDE7_PLEWA|nr:hypothetical protein NDU88_003533 [Pleurodeles waltl]